MSADREAARHDAAVLSDADCRALADAMRRAGVHLLEVEGPGRRFRLKLERSDGVPPAPASEPPTLVKAASLGRFRAAHPDGLFPTCAMGDAVGRGQVLGFVQVGLLLVPAAATRPGRLARVLVPDGGLVGYGTPLFELHHDP